MPSKSTLASLLLFCSLAPLGMAAESSTPRIGWYGTLQSGLAAARQNGKPILLVSAAPQCLGVSGIW